MNKVLTIVVTYNGMKWLQRCFTSLQQSSVPTDIMVIDNCSQDGTREYLSSLESETFKVVLSEENLGFAKANNIGFRYAVKKGYDYIYLLNQDAWIEKETFSVLVNAFEKAKGKPFGIISPLQMKADMSGYDEQFRKHCAKAVERSTEETVDVDFVMAAHWMISMDCLKKTGAFSPSFTHYGEDDNLIDRARFHGFRVGVNKCTKAVHDRDSRPRPKAYRMRLKVIHAKRMVSDPGRSLVLSLVTAPLWLIGMGLYHFSVDLVPATFKLISEYSELIRNRNLSMKEGAFLEIEA